ncbi:hypothetical protein SPFL3102_02658 [Sporomusaceae bacterium FL31]|nr:hypothetical protein SPFL3101_02633 [Sporomusaceae bacterium FL31]GCE34831.1 hypothetical protein SPFL3102_02658 [Sporomusaceae bacterium]
MAIIGQTLLNPESGWRRFDNPYSALTYTGQWDQGNYDGWYNKTSTYTSAVNASVKFNFIGTKLRIIGYRAPDRSNNIEVIIDGVNYSFSCNNQAASGYCSLVYEITNLSLYEHRVVIINKDSRYFNFDAIDIDETGTVTQYNPDIVVSPANLIATAGNAQITLSWDSVTDAVGYTVKRSLTSGGSYVAIVDNITTNSYVDTDVENGTTYYYVVSALVGGVESDNSNEAFATLVGDPMPSEESILKVIMIDSSEREYRIDKEELSRFLTWMDRPATVGTSFFVFDKVITESKEYVLFDKIISFEVTPIA